jgi:hypothetical protein
MAKKIIEQTEIKAPITKQSAEQKKAIRDALKGVVEKSVNNTPPPTINEPAPIIEETPPVLEQPTPPPIDDEIKIELSEIDNVKVDKVDELIDATHKATEAPEVKKRLSLFNTFKQKTEEDDNKNTFESVTENLYEAATNSQDVSVDEDSVEYQKTMSEAYAVGIVEAAELGIAFLCLVISGNWERGFEYYKISKDKKKAIIISIIKIRLAQNKKTNPTTGLWVLVGTALVPMVGMAIFERINKMKAEKKQKALLVQQQQSVVYEQPQTPIYTMPQSNFLSNNENNLKAYTNTKTETRGRHKKTCATQTKKGGICDCKG